MPERTSYRADQVHPSVFIAPGAVVVGDVSIGEDSSVWFTAVVRGDNEAIRIGRRTNVQDGCILHADPGFPCTLGDGVTLGHGAIVHGATVEDNVMIGMRSVVMNGAKVGAGSLIAVGAVVTEGVEIPPGSLVVGTPGKILRQVTEDHRTLIARAASHYIDAARMFKSERGA